ncbi:NAD(P)-dependent oxidoreductase [Nocardia sp. NBC_00416]|uniref:NAD(P)-dependent oxidoreductase n=1 Tax=Nocardia sp. NBC_00416 TaxID=2975991 RepID=UPI002E239B2F
MTQTDPFLRPSPDRAAPPTVGIVGVGAMGLPMARRLHAHGFSVRAVDISPARVAQCRAEGMQADDDLGIVAGSDIVLAMVATGAQLRELLTAPVVTGGGLRGAVLVVMSTVGPELLRDAASVSERHGLRLLDCPVTGGVAGAADGTLTLFAAGAEETLTDARRALEVVGTVHLVGPRLGDGQSFKLVNQMLAGIHLAAAGEAIAFAERLGLDPVLVQRLLPTGAASSWMLADRGPRMCLPAQQRPTETRLSVFVKDSGLVRAAAEDSGAHAPLTRAAGRAWAQAAELGFGDGDDSGIVEVFRRG